MGDFFYFFFFTDTATTEIYTLSLHDALPIRRTSSGSLGNACWTRFWTSTWALSTSVPSLNVMVSVIDRKSTRLNSSHTVISYAVFCLKKKKTIKTTNVLNAGYHHTYLSITTP